ncbi:MAG: hypothetical protein E7391_06790 [Ruminococcaceae bacterium]|nr:hypothetical protein [Oscillospiraceae bacterium]
MHISSPEQPWGKAFTNKRYLHPPFSENIITMWPNSTILISEITTEKPMWKDFEKIGKGCVYQTPSAGVVFTLKRDSDLILRQRRSSKYNGYMWSSELMPQNKTQYKTRKDGIPVHSFTKDFDVVKFHEEAFCDNERVPSAYIKVVVENCFGISQTVELGVLTRTGHEFLFTGCKDLDGYPGYNPTRMRWDSDEMTRYSEQDDYLTDGTYRLYFDKKENFVFDKEKNLNIVLELKPYEKRSFTFVFTRNNKKPKSYNKAKKETISFWKNELASAKNIPEKKGIEPLFYNLLVQQLQMFACVKGENYTIMRQGALQRYHWPEAKEIIKSLSHIGGYSKYIEAGISHYFNDLQEKTGDNKGRIHYENVPWNSRTAAGLEMFSYATKSDESFYDKYIENAMLGFCWIEKERSKSLKIDGAIPGLFPPGISTDNHFEGAQQWTFSDVAMLRAYECFLEVLKEKNSPYTNEVQTAYDDYFGIMKEIFEKFASEQKESKFLYLPRDAKNDPEIEAILNNDPFYYMFPNEALAVGLGGYGTEDAEKVIYTYSHGGQSKNGFIYPVYQSTSGMGRTWYTTWAEHSRYTYYKKSGNSAECKKIIDALLKYNVTNEYYQAERYDDHDAYTAPWMPNASANGRVLDMLFDYYGKRTLKH